MRVSRQMSGRQLEGLSPSVWCCVGPGYSREEVKSFFLERGIALVGNGITTPELLCREILRLSGASQAELSPLGATARQEVLRLLLNEPAISAHLPELKRLRRQRNFFDKLDRSIQAGMMCFAHEEERAVIHERLNAHLGENPIRDEMNGLARAYTAWIEAESLIDPPLLYEKATEFLRDQGWPSELYCPEKIVILAARKLESRELGFWEQLEASVSLEFLPHQNSEAISHPIWHWERWHTFDDAVGSLSPRLLRTAASKDAVVIPDDPSLRRSLSEAFRSNEVVLADPRDPTVIRSNERLKIAMLPLELVAMQYERSAVLSYVRRFFSSSGEILSQVNRLGVRRGLESYQGKGLSELFASLSDLEERFGGRNRIEEIKEAHLAWVAEMLAEDSTYLIIERLWKEFEDDLNQLKRAHRRAPCRYWYDRLSQRLSQLSPPAEPLQPRAGVSLYRLQQAPFFAGGASLEDAQKKHLWLVGLPSKWFSGEGLGDLWFTERAREVLCGEFPVRSAIQVREERLQMMEEWIDWADEVHILDAQYSWDGREQESILPALREFASWGFSIEAPEVFGSYGPRALSYGTPQGIQPQEIQLIATEVKELSASGIDQYSRCAFLGLATQRWKLEDEKDPESELWPEVKGQILHRAVEYMVRDRLSSRDSLDRAWKEVGTQGLLQSQRLKKFIQDRLLVVLDAFWEEEKKYRNRSGARSIGIEEKEPLTLSIAGGTLKGRPDRVDEIDDGIMVIDYKTASSVPNGRKMRKKSYRLQLPFYALAAQEKYQKKAIGAQFIQLTPQATRSYGVFFTLFNGKDAGCLTQLRKNSLSLFDDSPEETWGDFQKQLENEFTAYLNGKFSPVPKEESECRSCHYRDLCGRRRLLKDEGAVE